jgi:hypothetical protein
VDQQEAGFYSLTRRTLVEWAAPSTSSREDEVLTNTLRSLEDNGAEINQQIIKELRKPNAALSSKGNTFSFPKLR